MALFDETAPTENYFTPLRLATGSTRLNLAFEGYKADGSQNTWGKIGSWIPGFGIASNALAKSTASGAGLTGVAGNVADDTDNRMAKLMAQLGIAQAATGFATGNVQMGLKGLGSTLKSGTALATSGSGPDRSDDGMELNY